MEFKEFLDTMSGQIRSQKARAVAVREMEDHIRDQADFYESQGMSGGDALKEAVRQMGGSGGCGGWNWTGFTGRTWSGVCSDGSWRSAGWGL